MRRYIVLDKSIGQTPLECIEAWRAENPAYADVALSYAGRLDPMASGKLLVLIGDECKRQSHYTGLDKEYVVEVLLDVGSDTGDVLGIASASGVESNPSRSEISSVLKAEIGTRERAYPAFSSKTANGKPLFMYALEGTLDTIAIPTHPETIYDIRILGIEAVSEEVLRPRIQNILSDTPRSDEPSKALGQDFRINAVKESWDTVFEKAGARTFTIISLRVTVASGTYMRSLATRIGEAFGTKALALSIHRSKIGRYVPLLHFWSRSF